MVEFAIVAPVLMLLIFGVIDFGMLYQRQISFRSGLRSATRSAVVANFGGSSDCVLSPLDTASEANKQLICNVKRQMGLNDADTRVRIELVDANNDGQAKHVSYDDLRVCAMSKLKSVSGFFGPMFEGKASTGRLQMMIEKGTDNVPNLVPLETGGEGALDGRDWNFCSTGAAP